jgi:SAM-dependent methyltransferase
MSELWEKMFSEKQTMWGFEPTESALYAQSFFTEKAIKNILIPGIGYGRNAKPFLDNGIKVTGIEISKTAIDFARNHYDNDMKIHHGSVAQMPFDNDIYDGIFCFGLIYLLEPEHRKKLIANCYAQLKSGGHMIFSILSKNSPNYGSGTPIGKDCFELSAQGPKLFFYNEQSLHQEFASSGLTNFFEIEEPHKHAPHLKPFKFWIAHLHKP